MANNDVSFLGVFFIQHKNRKQTIKLRLIQIKIVCTEVNGLEINTMMNRTKRRSIFAGLYGNTLEWFDFLLYANFTPIFAQIFFHSHAYFVSLLLTFGVFAVVFCMRTLGGVLLGHYADHIGRRKTLIFSMSIMTFSTGCIALIPDYHSWGIISPLLFVLFRLIQGVAVGGELPGATTFLIEHME
ncbi:MAG: MFS transporter [Legionella sp.]